MLAPWIISHFPVHRVYVEPFAGAASVLFRKPRSYGEVLNERDGEIVNVFRVLRDPDLAEDLREACRLTPFARGEFEIAYQPADDPVEQARRTIFRSMAGFGSAAACGEKTGFRSNSNRSGTTPARDWSHYPNLIAAFTARLAGVVIENRDAAECMPQHDGPDTLHYLDPPYPIDTRKVGNPYCNKGYRFEMSDDEHRELAEVLHELEGAVVLSGYPCELYDEDLYPDWRRVTKTGPLADGARERTEVLWLNRTAVERGQQSLFGRETA